MWDFRLGFQPGYSDSWVTSAPATLKAASMREAALRRAELVELRWLVPTRIMLPSCILTEARLEDVSTSPLTSALMAITPWGTACRARMRLKAVLSSMASVGTGRFSSHTEAMSGSVTEYSSFSSASISSSMFLTVNASPGFTAITAEASRAMALRLLPPSIEQRTEGTSLHTRKSSLARDCTALERPLSMSSPLCPPMPPQNPALTQTLPAGTGTGV